MLYQPEIELFLLMFLVYRVKVGSILNVMSFHILELWFIDDFSITNVVQTFQV